MRIYYGWFIVAASMVGYTVGFGMTMGSFGLFVIPVSEDLGISRANINTALVIIALGNSIAAPIIGRWADRYKLRPIVIMSAAIFGLGMATVGLSHNLWVSIFALAVLIPIGIDGGTIIPFNMAVARWFRTYRARALAISAFGLSISGVILPPIISLLIESFGWRVTLIVLAAAATVILFLAGLVLRDFPSPNDVETTSGKGRDQRLAQDAYAGRLLSYPELFAMPKFWLVCVVPTVVSAATTALLVSFVPIAVGAGVGPLEAAGLFSLASICGLVAKGIVAVIGDLLDQSLLMGFITILGVPLNLILLSFDGYIPLVACGILLGINYGASVPVLQAILVSQFGIKSYGTVRGLASLVNGISNAVGLRFAGEVFDRTGDYAVMYQLFAVIFLIGSIAVVWGCKMKSGPEPA